jgi:hypothetical protein
MWRIQHPFRKAESGIGLDVNFAVELLRTVSVVFLLFHTAMLEACTSVGSKNECQAARPNSELRIRRG